ncbi:TPA: hypothetical protein ACX6QN_003589 [Photobacterium damselae]
MSENKYRELIKNFSYVFMSNLISVFISIIMLGILPKFLSVSDFGYIQLYLFYTTFIGLLHFGINDGIYLRLGGGQFSKIDKGLYFSNFYLLAMLQISIAIIGLSILFIFNFNDEKKFVLTMTLLTMVIVNSRYMLLFILQATYKIKEYSFITIFDRTAYLVGTVGLLLCNENSYMYFIAVDVIAKLLSLLFSCYCCRSFVFVKLSNFNLKYALQETLINFRIGVKLMLSNVAGKLIVGNVRFGIEAMWSVVIFGKVSLMLSATSFVMIFINSISLVLFPFLRRLDKEKLSGIYLKLRSGIGFLLLFFLLLYFPIYWLLSYWLPDYKDMLTYLHVIFPVVIFEGKMSLLVNTYLKVLRKEKTLLYVNLGVVLLSFISTIFIIYIMKNLQFAIYSILFLVAVRVVIFELFLQKILSVRFWIDTIFEIFLVLIYLFIVTHFTFSSAFFIYFLLVFSFGFMKKNALIEIVTIISGKLKINSI